MTYQVTCRKHRMSLRQMQKNQQCLNARQKLHRHWAENHEDRGELLRIFHDLLAHGKTTTTKLHLAHYVTTCLTDHGRKVKLTCKG